MLCFQLSFDTELLKKFWFLKRIISPILEAYYVAACRLTLLQQAEMPGIRIGVFDFISGI